MKVNLRFGMHRDTQILHQEKNKIDGLVMPAHVLAYQPASTSVFLTSLPRHPYLIDPMTSLFQAPSEGDLRESVRRLCDRYHPDLAAILESVSPGACMTPADFPDTGEFCQGVVQFQRVVVALEAKTSKAAKYITKKGFGGGSAGKPRLIVAPYFGFNRVGDSWYRYSLKCAKTTLELCTDEDVGFVLHCPIGALDETGIRRIRDDYGNFENVIVWLDNFNELSVEESDIISARLLIERFDTIAQVEALYGGYLLMLMESEGIAGVSHGILFSQHRSSELTPGAGGVPERYYIPAFHEFRSLSQTDLILHKHRELICECEICEDVMEGNPDNLIRFEDNPELLRRHFLTVRKEEASRVMQEGREDLLAELTDVFTTYHDSIRSLPNPDAVVSRATMTGLAYLERWVSGLREEI